MPLGLSNNNLRLVVTAAANPTTYGHLLTQLPAGSHALELFYAPSLFGQKYLDLDGNQAEWRQLSPEVLAARVVKVTDWGWEYLRSQGLEVEAGPGEGDGPTTTRFPPDLPPVLAQHLHRIQINPEKGRIFRLSEVMGTLREMHPHYNLQKRGLYKEKLKNLLVIFKR